jgi:NAD/NADP transhydrogenase beta subunit
MIKLKINKENAPVLWVVLQLNLILGIHNIYLYTIGGAYLPFIIGAVNIWVWVFYRKLVSEYLG